MSDITGPISTMPGSIHNVPKGTVCDYHPDKLAVIRIQGETDSFGSEMIDLCEECKIKDIEESKNIDTSGNCEWCEEFANKLYNKRDYEEGMSGRIYLVCKECIDKQHIADLEELEEYSDKLYWD